MVDEKEVQRFYDRVAPGYSTTHARRFSDEIMEYFLLRALPTGRLRILDAGCGVGRFAMPLARMGHEVTGCDLSAKMLRQLGKNASQDGIEIKLVQGSLTDMPQVESDYYDVAIALNQVLDTIADCNLALAEIARVTKTGSLLIGSVNNRFKYAVIEDLQKGYFRKFINTIETGDRYVNWTGKGKGHVSHEFTLEELTESLVSNSFSLTQILGIFNLFNKYQLPKWIKDPKKREALKQLQIKFAQKPEFINNSQEYFFVAQNHKHSD